MEGGLGGRALLGACCNDTEDDVATVRPGQFCAGSFLKKFVTAILKAASSVTVLQRASIGIGTGTRFLTRYSTGTRVPVVSSPGSTGTESTTDSVNSEI